MLLTSLALNNPGEKFELILLHSGISGAALEGTARRCSAYGWSFSPLLVEDALFEGAPVTKQYPKEMYYRLLAPELLPERHERALYLDPDILVINPIRELWETDLRGRLFAAASHTAVSELANGVNQLRLGTEHEYFNSGVLLMDLAADRREILPADIFSYVGEHRKGSR